MIRMDDDIDIGEIYEEIPKEEEQEEQEEKLVKLNKVKPESIEIKNKEYILPYLKPQENKYWHFTFINQTYHDKLIQILENIPGYNITVEYGIPQSKPDLTLLQNGEIVGKIHLLLCDRRDANLPEKYYCKIYFFDFKNEDLYEKVKNTMINFFENFKSVEKNNKVGGKIKKTIKVNNRKSRKGIKIRKNIHNYKRITRRN
jgi:hypothetical protein